MLASADMSDHSSSNRGFSLNIALDPSRLKVLLTWQDIVLTAMMLPLGILNKSSCEAWQSVTAVQLDVVGMKPLLSEASKS